MSQLELYSALEQIKEKRGLAMPSSQITHKSQLKVTSQQILPETLAFVRVLVPKQPFFGKQHCVGPCYVAATLADRLGAIKAWLKESR